MRGIVVARGLLRDVGVLEPLLLSPPGPMVLVWRRSVYRPGEFNMVGAVDLLFGPLTTGEEMKDYYPGRMNQKVMEGEASYFTVKSCLREGTSGIMANGEALDDTKLVCASWFYPFGARLRVTASRSGRSVVVVVSDRGPAKRLVEKGRIIDLSQAAFEAIADLKDGVIAVKTELLEGGAHGAT